MKKIVLIIVSALMLAAAALVTSIVIEVRRAQTATAEEVVRLTVKRGAPFAGVVEQLHRDGLVRRPWALKAYAKATRADRRVRRGTYEFSRAESPLAILDRLVAGDVLRLHATIPEGFTMWEIAGAFAHAGVDSLALLGAIQSAELRTARRVDAPSLEGYLFPDTYNVPYGVSALEVVEMMLARLDDVYDNVMLQQTVELGMTPHEILTLASIVEAETRVPEERPLVAAVYHNRIRKRMRLEADPTVAYAMGGYKGRLLYADLKIESPYNTYRNAGLPPGPICSPGEASIRAALYPDSESTELYFVARGDGSHIFSRTLQEHLANVKSVRRTQREARRAAGGQPTR